MAVDTDCSLKKESPSKVYCLGICLAYAIVSVTITFVNKVVLSTYQFRSELALILLQLLVGTASILSLSAAGVCMAPEINLHTARTALPLSLWFFLYVFTGLGSLRSLTVPTWSAMRRLTALFILLLDSFWDGKAAAIKIWLSVILMLIGAIVAAAGDLDGDVWGYGHVLLNCLTSALYLRAVTSVKKRTGLSEVGVLYYTNILALPLVLFSMLLCGELPVLYSFEHWKEGRLQWGLTLSALLAALLNYLVFLSATVNSPLTTSIVGQAKNVVGSLGGLIFMPTAAGGNPVHVGGLLLGLCSSVWYAVLKYRAWPAPVKAA